MLDENESFVIKIVVHFISIPFPCAPRVRPVSTIVDHRITRITQAQMPTALCILIQRATFTRIICISHRREMAAWRTIY